MYKVHCQTELFDLNHVNIRKIQMIIAIRVIFLWVKTSILGKPPSAQCTEMSTRREFQQLPPKHTISFWLRNWLFMFRSNPPNKTVEFRYEVRTARTRTITHWHSPYLCQWEHSTGMDWPIREEQDSRDQSQMESVRPGHTRYSHLEEPNVHLGVKGPYKLIDK